MTLLDRFDFQDMAFSLYFLGYADASKIPADRKERAKWMFSQPAVRSLLDNSWYSGRQPSPSRPRPSSLLLTGVTDN